MNLTPLSRKIILHLGLHGWLTHQQLQQLEFPQKSAYHSLQRQIREYLFPLKMIERVYLEDGKTPIFRLSKKGAKVFKEMTDRKAIRPAYRLMNLKHDLLVHQLLIELIRANRIELDDFKLECQINSIRPDAVFTVANLGEICLEVDRGTEPMIYIQSKWKKYEREYELKNLKSVAVFWYSSRAVDLNEWINEIAKNITLQKRFITPPEKKILRAVDSLHLDKN